LTPAVVRESALRRSLRALGSELGFHPSAGTRLLRRRLGEGLSAHLLPSFSVGLRCRGPPTSQWVYPAKYVKESIYRCHWGTSFLVIT
jgi:hypothetical protein